jgi:enoyl-CoA hydratase/carnithine racemase
MRLVDRRGISNAARHHRTECRAEVVKNPPLSVRATVRSRRWYMDQLEREVTMQTAPLKLYLTEDFQEAARAFAEKRQPGPFKGR